MSTYYVAKTGDDGNDGTFENPWLTITHAMDTFSGGDTVIVRAGTYNECIVEVDCDGTLLNPTIIKNYTGERPIIDGGATLPAVDNSQLFTSWSDYVYISGFEIKNSNILGAHLGGAGLFLLGSNSKASDIIVHDCWDSGMYMYGDYSIIEDCVVYNCCLNNSADPGHATNGSGMSSANQSNYATIRRNTVHDNWGEGISVFNTFHATVEDNTIYDNWSVNLYLSDSENAIARRNLVYRTKDMTDGGQVGIFIGDEVGNPTSNYITVVYNIVYGCKRNFFCGKLTNTIIANNTFVNSVQTACVQINNETMVASSFVNNIIVQDDELPVVLGLWANVELVRSHNLWSKTPTEDASGVGDVIGNPDFLTSSNFHLQSISPAINAGIDIGLTEDFDGNPIIGIPDIGAYEYQSEVTRPFAYNPSKSPITGTTQTGDLAIGNSNYNLPYFLQPGGILWWGGPNESVGYVICYPFPAGNRSTPIGNIGTVGFWRSNELTDNSFISLVSTLSGGTVTTIGGIQTWLASNGYWSSYTFTTTTTTTV